MSSNIRLPEPGSLVLPGLDDVQDNDAGSTAQGPGLPQPGTLFLPGLDDVQPGGAVSSSQPTAESADMPDMFRAGPNAVDIMSVGLESAGVGGFEEPAALPRPTAAERAAFTLRGLSGVSLDDAVLAYLAKTTEKVDFDIALRNMPTTKKVVTANDWFDRLDAMDPQARKLLADRQTAALVKEDVDGWQRFRDILNAPSGFARDVMSGKSMAEALAVLPRAPFNIAEGAYQGVQAFGGLMRAAGLEDWGKAVERFGRRHADNSRAVLNRLSPVGGRLDSREIADNPGKLFSEEGLAWLIGSVGDTGARQLSSILGYIANPALGAALGGATEGAAFYEQLRRDDVDVYNALLQAAAFGGATGILDRIGLDAMLPQYAPRTANHLLDRAMGVVGDRLDRGIARLPRGARPVADAVRAGAVEGVTEYLENPIQGALEGVAREEGGADIWGRTREGFEDWTVMLPAAVLGGGMRAIGERGARRPEGSAEASAASAPQNEAGGDAVFSDAETDAALKAEWEEVARYEQAANERLAFGEALKQAAEEGDRTRLKAKSPEAFADAFGRVVPESHESVWLDPDTAISYARERLAPSEGGDAPGVDGARMERNLAVLGLTAERVREAQRSGAPLEVRTMDVVSLQPGPVRDALVDMARPTPDGMTAQEAARIEPETLLDDAVKRVRNAQRERQDVIREERRLVDEIARAGYPEHAARDYGSLLRANAEAYHARYGADAAGLLRQISVTNAEDLKNAEGLFQKHPLAGRFADMPTVEADSSQWFGEGKEINADDQHLRKAIQDWAKVKFPQGTAFKNTDRGWDIQVSPRGITKTLSHGYDKTLARSVPFIPQIIESGIYLDSIEKQPGLMSHIFANKIRLDGQDYVVGFVLREDGNGNRFYDHELTEIINPDSLNADRFPEKGSVVHAARANRGDVMNILRDRLGVNDGTGRVLFQRGGEADGQHSLAGRFADMPTVEADSSQWFGEGKEINADSRNLRKAVQEWAKTKFPQGMEIANSDTGWGVQVAPRGIRNTLAHGGDDILARSVPFIPQIIESGVYLDSIEKKPGLMSHIFANKIRLDGQDYVVGFVLREDGNGNRFYDHELTEIINPDSLNTDRFPEKGSVVHVARANRGDVMNILRDRLGVNDGTGRVLFQRGGLDAEAKLREEAAAWGKTVDGIVSSGKPRRSTLMLTQTPLVMHMLGADFKELHAAPHVFDGLFPEQAKAGHNPHPNITADILKQLPEAMADPIMVFDSNENGRFTFMLGVKDASGATVVVPVELEGKSGGRKSINIAVSAFAKENNGVPNNQWFVQQAQKNLRYMNEAKALDWSRSAGAQYPFVRLSRHETTILTEADLDKLKAAHPGYYQAPGGRDARGSVAFARTPEGEAQTLIRIFKGHDLSTVLHEAAHVWTKNLEDIANNGVETALRAFDECVAGLGRMPDELTNIAFRTLEGAQSGQPSKELRKLLGEVRQARDRAVDSGDETLSRLAGRMGSAIERLRRTLSGLEQAREDIRTLREAAGVPPEGPLSAEQDRLFQERTATGAEAYFMEGKAPTAKLRRVFANLRNWLAKIYRNARNLFGRAGFEGGELSDEVRTVFDRMLTTDDAVARDRRRRELLAGADEVNAALADRLGEDMDAREWDELNALLGEADRAVTAQMDAATLRDRKKRLSEFRKIAAEAVEQEPFWQAIEYLGNKDVGLNRDLLERDYGKESVRNLTRTKRGLVRSSGGVQLDVVATELGYSDADTLWNEMQDRLVADGQTKQREISRRAQQMLEAEDARLVGNADEMAGDAYGAYLDAVERASNRLLGKARGLGREAMRRFAESVRTPRAVLTDRAATEIANTRITDIRPDRYNAALRKAQREIARALREGETVASLRALDGARMANELYAQAVKTRVWVEGLEAGAKKLARVKPDAINELAREGLRRALSRFGLAKVSDTPYVRGDEAVSLRNIVAALSPDVELLRTDDGSGRVAGGNLAADAFPDWLLDDRAPSSDQPVDASGYIHYRRLTPNQLRDVDNLLKYLEHRGHEMCRANKASEAARVEAQAAAGAAPMLELKAKRIAPEGGVREKGLRLKDGFLAEMDNLRSTFIRADAYSNISVDGKAGFNETNLLRPLLEGENKKRLLWGDEAEKLTPLLERIAGSIAAANARYGERLGGLKRRDGAALHVPAKMRNKRRSWTMERVFGMALQLGNASNTARLRSGFPDLDMETVAVLLGDEAARRVFSGDDGPSFNPLEANGRNEGLLTAEDWKAVQAVWDAVNALWPETEATHRALFGFAPKKVEATPLRLSVGGETLFLSGGYFPAKYDPRLSEKMAGKQEREDILRGETTQYAAPSAKRGHTKARAEQAPGEALRLDLGQMLEHIDEAVTFIALGPAVRHVDRVTQAPVWKNAYVRAFGEEEYKAIRENLKGMVGKQRNETAGQDAADIARRFLTYSALSWNMNTVVMQLDALGKSMADQGAAPVLRGLGKLVSGNPAKLIREIEAASPYMESRSKTIDRDLRKQAVDMSKLVKAKESRLSMAGMAFTVEQVAELGMVPMQVMDQLVSAAVWLGAYQKRMRELGAEAKGIEANSARHEQAVAHADMMVKRANPDWDGTSRTKFQRNPGYNMLNMFAGAATLVFQRQRMQYQVLRAGKATAAQYARFQAYDTLLPAAAFWLFAEACVAAFGDDEKKKERDKKPWQRRALEGLADYASPAVPVAGPLASSFFIGGMQSSGRGVWDKPLRLAGKTVGTTRKLISGEPVKGKKVTAADEALVLLDLAGFAARIPTRRIGTYGENVSNLLENPGR